MFDIWRKIAEKGAVAVPVKASALSALGWVEVGEKWPELIPEEFRHHDVYSDPQLIWKSPFVCEDDKQYLFVATDPSLGKTLKVSIGYNELLGALGAEDYYNDYEASWGIQGRISKSDSAAAPV